MMTKNEALKAVAKRLVDLSEAVLNLIDQEEPTSVVNEEPATVKEETIKLEDVRAVLSKISRAGKVAEMKALLAEYGVTKLSDVDPANYPALLSEANKIAEAVNA
ncbi:MAG: hypothetical protein IJQ24_04570 [Synergistaceae bacterium]|nr:hypothetical protein [Synergistaceae bacterium]